MLLRDLRYPVALWSDAPPLHQISALALAFPQAQLPLFEHAEGNSTTGDDAAKAQQRKTGAPVPSATGATGGTAAAPLSLICPTPFAPHAFLVSGSLTGELAHWSIPSYRSREGQGEARKQCGSQHAVPRGLMLRQGASSCTAVTYCRAGMTQMWCSGSSEGFLTLWSFGGGRCIRSELSLPFGPTHILFLQRWNPHAHKKPATPSASGSPSPSPSPPASSTGSPQPSRSTSSSTFLASSANAPANYLLCSCEQSREVYVVSLPSLAVVAVLAHRAPVCAAVLTPPSFTWRGRRTPCLVSVDQTARVYLWDLSRIEKMREDKARLRWAQRQQRQAQQARGGGGNITISLAAANGQSPSPPPALATGLMSPASPEALLPLSFANPPSSLASNSASIIPPNSSTAAAGMLPPAPLGAGSTPMTAGGAAGSAPSLQGIIARWSEPTHSFLLPLPPLAFSPELGEVFLPSSVAVWPDGSKRAVIAFPYAFVLVDLEKGELLGRELRAMGTSSSSGVMGGKGRSSGMYRMSAFVRHSHHHPSSARANALTLAHNASDGSAAPRPGTTPVSMAGKKGRRLAQEPCVEADNEEDDCYSVGSGVRGQKSGSDTETDTDTEGDEGTTAEDDDGTIWGEEDAACVAKHAPFAGAGFLMLPSSATSASAQAQVQAQQQQQQQFLVLWNANGEFVWLFSLTSLPSDEGSSGPNGGPGSLARKQSRDELFLSSAQLSPASDARRRSLSSLRTESAPSVARAASTLVSSPPTPVPTAGQPVRGSSVVVDLSVAFAGTTTVGGARGTGGSATGAWKVQLVAQCLMHAPEAAHSSGSTHGASPEAPSASPAFSSASPPATSPSPHGAPHVHRHAQHRPTSLPSSFVPHLSGHTIYAGTDAGEIFQWHVPLCSSGGAEGAAIREGNMLQPRVILPAHVSRIADGFGAPTQDNAAAVNRVGNNGAPLAVAEDRSGRATMSGGSASSTDQQLVQPKIVRAVTAGSVLQHVPATAAATAASSSNALAPPSLSMRSPSRQMSQSPGSASSAAVSDPASASVILLDTAQEAMLLAIGRRSGKVSVLNVLSRASRSVDFERYHPHARHSGPVTSMLHLPFPPSWGDACVLATAGVDGRVMLLDASTATLVQVLRCSAPVLSLHRPPLAAEDALQDEQRRATALAHASGSSSTAAISGLAAGSAAFYRGANASVLFVNCSDNTLRGFSLANFAEVLQAAAVAPAATAVGGVASPFDYAAFPAPQCVFVARGLDAPVRALFRPLWALLSDQVVVLTKVGSVYLYTLTGGQLVASWSASEGAAMFLQKHDLIAPGSQLAILAHRLHQVKQLRRRTLRSVANGGGAGGGGHGGEEVTLGQALTAVNAASSLSRHEESPLPPSLMGTTSGGSTGGGGAGTFVFENPASMANGSEGVVTHAKDGEMLHIVDSHFGSGGGGGGGGGIGAGHGSAMELVTRKHLPTSYERAPPPLSRSVSTLPMPALRRTNSSIGGALASPMVAHSTLKRMTSSLGVDAGFQKWTFLMHQSHQQLERDEAEWKAAQQINQHVAALHTREHYSALNPPVPNAGGSGAGTSAGAGGPARAGPLQQAYTGSAAPSAPAAKLHSTGHGGPLLAVPAADSRSSSPAPGATGAGNGGGATSFSSSTSAPVSSGSGGAARSAISLLDVVSSSPAGSSLGSLAHLHVSVYLFNVSALASQFAAAYATQLGARSRRAAAEAAARADPSNAALAAAALQARREPLPASFYILSGLLSTMIDWDSHLPGEVEKALREALALYPSRPRVAFASLSDNAQAMSVLFPRACSEHGRWAFDGELSTRHVLSLSSVLNALAGSLPPEARSSWVDPVRSFYSSTLPRCFPLYVEPDVHSLASFALNPCAAIHRAARRAVAEVLARVSPARLAALEEESASLYCYPIPAQRLLFQPEFALTTAELASMGCSMVALTTHGPGMGIVSDEELRAAAILCWVGAQQRRAAKMGPAILPPPGLPGTPPRPSTASSAPSSPAAPQLSEFQARAQYLVNTLVRQIAWPPSSELDVTKSALACDLLRDGLATFRYQITEPLLLFRRLYALSQLPLQKHESLARAAHAALMDCGKVSPQIFVECLAREAGNVRLAPSVRGHALATVAALVKHHPAALAAVLPDVVSLAIKCLEHGEQAARAALMREVTTTLLTLVEHYPHAAFHQDSQRFAVGQWGAAAAGGTPPHCALIVWDLRTATKWRVLEGHAGSVHAVAFHPRGALLASYSADERPFPTVRVWSTAAAGFWAGLLGMEGKCVQHWQLSPCVRAFAAAPLVQTRKQQPPRHSPARAPSPTVSRLSSASSSSSAADDVDEPPDSDDDDDNSVAASATRGAPSTRTGSGASNAHAASYSFSLRDLFSVKLSWTSERALKLQREDKTSLDFVVTV